MGYAGASKKSPNDAAWEMPSPKLRRPIYVYPGHQSGYERRYVELLVRWYSFIPIMLITTHFT